MRHRYIIVGIRSDLKIKFSHPKPTTKDNPRTCRAALHDPEIPKSASHNEIRPLQSQVQERLSHIKPGGNAWSEGIPERLQLNVKGARLSNIYRRMDPNLPAFTITGSGGGGTHGYHWEENRALTNREKARVQTFPDDYEFVGGVTSIRKQIGMAVPPLGAKVIFDELVKSLALSEPLGPPIKVDLTKSTSDRSYLNIHVARGRLNKKTGVTKTRHWSEMELKVGRDYPELPKKFKVYTSFGCLTLNRTSGGAKGKPEEGIHKLAGKGSDKRLFGEWLKGKIYAETSLEEGSIIDDDALEEYGSTTLDFYKIEEELFLLKYISSDE